MEQYRKSFKVDGWQVYDLPVQYAESDYEEAREEIVDKVQKTPGLIALFEYGCIPALGISDMDFWAVFADDAEEMRILSEPIFSKKTRYLMMHKMTVITEKHYHKMLYFDPWTTYPWPNGQKLLWQKEDIKRDLNFGKISFTQEERNILSAAYIEEILGLIYPIIPFYANKELFARKTLETIKDCIYIIEEINILADRKINPVFLNFSDKFKNLRDRWFEMNLQEAVKQLIDLLYQGLIVSFEVAFSLADWLGKNCDLISIDELKVKKTNFWNQSWLDKKAQNIYLNTFKNKRVFTDFVKTPGEALRLSLNSYKKIKINLGWRTKVIDFYIIFQPFKMAGIPLGLISQKGLLSDNLRRDVFTNQEKAPVLRSKIFQERSQMVNEITEIYNRKYQPNSYSKGFIYGNHRFDYRFERENLKRKVLNFYLKRKFWQTANLSNQLK